MKIIVLWWCERHSQSVMRQLFTQMCESHSLGNAQHVVQILREIAEAHSVGIRVASELCVASILNNSYKLLI